MLPNLSSLSLPTATYPPSLHSWDDRDDLVQGGCRGEGTNREIECYNEWTATLTGRANEHPQANAVVLLSVGAGVLELRTLKLLQTLRSEGGMSPIRHVVLVDPEVPVDDAGEVLAHYMQALDPSFNDAVAVEYFVGETAYAEATNYLRSKEGLAVAVAGALNYSLGVLWSDQKSIAKRREAIEFVRRLGDGNDAVRVVQAWWNQTTGHAHRDESPREFAVREEHLVDRLLLAASTISFDQFEANECRRAEELRGGGGAGPSQS
jgi:hypothetical protein